MTTEEWRGGKNSQGRKNVFLSLSLSLSLSFFFYEFLLINLFILAKNNGGFPLSLHCFLCVESLKGH